MVDPEDLKMDNGSEFDLDGDFIELTQIVDEDKSSDEDIIELTEPLVDEDNSFDEDIIELAEPLVNVDETDPIIGVSTGNEDHISEAQIQSVLEKIIEEKYAHRMDELFSDTIHKVVEKEMEKIKNTLLQALTAK